MDAYAFSATGSHATGAYFTDSSGAEIKLFGWEADWYPQQSPRWVLYDATGPVDSFLGGFDQPVHLEVIMDGSAGEAYGRLTYSGGVYETTHTPITPQEIASLTTVAVAEDFRDPAYLGADYDNFLVATSSVPEPSSLLLLCTGLGGLVSAEWRRKKG